MWTNEKWSRKFFWYSTSIYKNSSQISQSFDPYFTKNYSFTRPLNISKEVDFIDPALNATVKFDNGTIVTWATVNVTDGLLYLGNVSLKTSNDLVTLAISAYNSAGLNAAGYINVTLLVNEPLYNNIDLTNFTLVAGDSNQTYNVTGLFSDHKGHNITLTSTPNNSVEWRSIMMY